VLQGVRQAGDNAAVSQAAPRYRAYFVFYKNRRNPTNSRLTLYRTRLTDGRTYRVGRWRAGSGDATKDAGRNPCAVDHGWLPNGWYNGVAHYRNFDGGLIFGTVWQLNDKQCSDGTPRTALFIHSEMTPAGGQACSRSNYREDQCWDGISDYKSEGCIKLKPADVKEAASLARRLGGPKLVNGTSPTCSTSLAADQSTSHTLTGSIRPLTHRVVGRMEPPLPDMWRAKSMSNDLYTECYSNSLVDLVMAL
jgi:hypothetical protein